MKRILGVHARLFFAAITVIGLVTVVTAVPLFTQFFDSESATATVLTVNCGSASTSALIGTPAAPLIGTGGTILFTCTTAPSTTSAIVATSGSATPTITGFGAPYGALSIVTHSNTATTCTMTTPTLVSGTSFAFTAGSYDYCASYTNWPSTGAAAFSITWSQP